MSRTRDASALAYSMWARTAAPRPVQRHEPTAEEIRKESMQLFYGQMLHDGHDEETARELTTAHFAIADHREQENQS